MMHVPGWALRLAPYIGAAGLVVGLCLWSYTAGRDSRSKEISQLTAERDVAASNVVAMQAAVARQNAAVAQMRVAGEAMQREAARAILMAQERREELAGVNARLRAAARSVGPQDSCTVPAAAAEAWEAVR